MLDRCKHCQADIVVHKVPPRNVGQCPNCNEPYYVVADASGTPLRLSFEGDGNEGRQRICSRCGNGFEDTSNLQIPVCENCRTGEFRVETAADDWMVRKQDGRVFGPISLEELRQLALKGLLGRSDQLRGPGQAWTAAHKLAQLQNLLPPASGSAKERDAKAPAKSARVWQRQIVQGLLIAVRRSLKWLLLISLLAVAYALGREAWRGLRQAPPVSDTAQTWHRHLQEIRDEALLERRGAEPAAFDVGRAEVQLNQAAAWLDQDTFESYRRAVKALKQLLPQTVDAPAPHAMQAMAMGLLAEASAALGQQLHDVRLAQRAVSLAQMAKQTDEASVFGHRAYVAALLRADNAPAALQAAVQSTLNHADFHKDARLTLYRAAAMLATAQDEALAEEHLLKLQKSAPQMRETISWLARAAAQRGAWRTAAGLWQSRLQLDATHAPSMEQLGYAQEVLGELPAAQKQYEAALRYEPTLTLARLRLGWLLERRGDDTDTAIRHMHEVLARYQHYSDKIQQRTAGMRLCGLYMQRNDAALALEYCEQSLRGSPYFVDALLLRAMLNMSVAESRRTATADLATAAQTAPNDVRVHVLGARLLSYEAQQSEALRLLLEQQAAHVHDGLLLGETLRLMVEQGRREEASRLLRQAAPALRPGVLYAEQRIDRAALRLETPSYEALSALADKWRRSPALRLLLGDLALRLEMPKQAENWWNEALQIDSDYAPAALHLADYWNRAGFYGKSLQLLKRFLPEGELAEFAQLLSAEAWVGQGEFAKAAAQLSRGDYPLNAWGCRFTAVQAQVEAAAVQGWESAGRYLPGISRCAAAPHLVPQAVQALSRAPLYQR